MIKIFLLIVLPFSLFASKILSYNIYERSDRADVMITFDTPYHGVLKQSKSKNRIIIKLQDAQIESSKIKKVNSDYLHALTLTPLKGQTQILATISPDVRLIASKTSDAYGLRLRFTKKIATSKKTSQESQANLSNLPTKKSGEFSKSYYIVVSILIIGIIILLILKKKIAKQTNKPQDSWLFNSATQIEQKDKATQNPASTHTASQAQDNVTIRFQKAIDTQNSVVMLEYADVSYLVLMGHSSILLDKFYGNKPNSQQEFETILQDRNQILEDFIGSKDEDNNFSSQSKKEPLQAYKERAAVLSYTEEA